MNDEIRRKLTAIIDRRDLDAIVCLSPENFAYAAGFVVPSQTLMRWRHAAVILTAAGDVAVVCVDMEEATVRRERPDWLVRPWAEFSQNAFSVLGTLLKELDATRRVGIELDFLAYNQYEDLRRAVPSATLVAVDGELAGARALKTPSEIELLGELSRISDNAIADSLAAVKAGDSEMDIAAVLARRVYEQGAQTFKLMIVATGERSQLPNVGPSSRILEPGDICRVEIFSVKDGYQAGVCRTACVGEPDATAAQIYQRLSECKTLVLEAMKPGATASSVYAAYREHFDTLNMPPISFVGHSIGVNLHEEPYLGPFSEQELQAGMVLGMEPLVYRTGHGYGMQIKDMVSIDSGGAQLLSDVTDTEQMILVEA